MFLSTTIFELFGCLLIGALLGIVIGIYIRGRHIDYELDTRFFKLSIKINSDKKTK